MTTTGRPRVSRPHPTLGSTSAKRQRETRTVHRNAHRGSAIQDRRSTDVFDWRSQEALVPEIGDQIQVMGTKVDQASRVGVVTKVRGGMVTVQWATGDQSVFVPGPGALTVLGRAKTARKAPARKPAKTAQGPGAEAHEDPRARPRRGSPRRPPRKAPARKPAKTRAQGPGVEAREDRAEGPGVEAREDRAEGPRRGSPRRPARKAPAWKPAKTARKAPAWKPAKTAGRPRRGSPRRPRGRPRRGSGFASPPVCRISSEGGAGVMRGLLSGPMTRTAANEPK